MAGVSYFTVYLFLVLYTSLSPAGKLPPFKSLQVSPWGKEKQYVCNTSRYAALISLMIYVTTALEDLNFKYSH